MSHRPIDEMNWTQKVVNLLASRGIEATPSQVEEWANLMVERWNKSGRKKSTPEQWMRAVLAEMVTLHLHFGDAQ